MHVISLVHAHMILHKFDNIILNLFSQDKNTRMPISYIGS